MLHWFFGVASMGVALLFAMTGGSLFTNVSRKNDTLAMKFLFAAFAVGGLALAMKFLFAAFAVGGLALAVMGR